MLRLRTVLGLLLLFGGVACGGGASGGQDAASDTGAMDAGSTVDASSLLPPGAACTEPQACNSGFCTDSVCCDVPACPPCQRCASGGTCEPTPDGDDARCPTFCATGQCQPCPRDMAFIVDFCIDRFEAPNEVGALPLVMYSFVEAEAWCEAKGKRLCYDDEWTQVCGGDEELAYPYGDTHQPGVCNDDETWMSYNQPLLNGWPPSVCAPDVSSVVDLFEAARAVSAVAAAAADHVEAIYQAEPSGSNAGCSAEGEAFDLCGNVEEWTRRRDGGEPDFHGNLKGRYWAESRTCQSNVLVHGDYFRFYEIGFRCCTEATVAP